jgi:hypothetical protein
LYNSNENGVYGHATKIDARVAQQVASSGTLLIASSGMETQLIASDVTFNTVSVWELLLVIIQTNCRNPSTQFQI